MIYNRLNNSVLQQSDLIKLHRLRNFPSMILVAVFLIILIILILLAESNKYFLYLIVLTWFLHFTLHLNHECWHRIFVSNKIINDLLGRFFSIFIGVPFSFGQYLHFNHHRDLNGPQDPGFIYTNSNLSNNELLFKILGNLFLLNHIKNFKKLGDAIKGNITNQKTIKNLNWSLKLADVLIIILFHMAFMFFCIAVNQIDFFILYEYAVLALLPFIDSLRTLIDHKKGSLKDSKDFTRNFKISLLDKIITKPYFDYHSLHHSFPQIPQYNLPLAERIVIKNRPHNYFNSNCNNSFSALLESLD